jgi:hypothetical protein
MSIVKAKFVNEAIKHLQGRKLEEIKNGLIGKSFTLFNSRKQLVKITDVSDDLDVKFTHVKTGEKIYSLPLDIFTKIYNKEINEAIKHLSPRSKEDIISKAENLPLYNKFLAGLENDIPELVKVALNQHSYTQPTDAVHELGITYIENKTLSFRITGTWKVDDNDKIIPWTDPLREYIDYWTIEIIDFIEKHNIKYRVLHKQLITAYMEFTGNARDIIQFIIKFIAHHEQRALYMIEEIFDMIYN